MKSYSVITHSCGETEAFAEEFAKKLKSGDVIAFSGGLGAGKTAFVRGLARGLGINDRVSSPTFAIVNEYCGNLPLFHFDMYRITDEDDLYSVDFDSYLDRNGICAIEWSENIKNALPPYYYEVNISVMDENTRLIEITKAE